MILHIKQISEEIKNTAEVNGQNVKHRVGEGTVGGCS